MNERKRSAEEMLRDEPKRCRLVEKSQLNGLFLLFSLLLFASRVQGARAEGIEKCNAKKLSSEKLVVAKKGAVGLDLFSFPGMQKHPLRAFADVKLIVNLTDDVDYGLYQGPNCSSVLEAYEHDQRLFGLLRSVELWRSHRLDPFTKSVVGVSTREPYVIAVKIWKLNVIRFAVFLFGTTLFLFARRLVRNALFYYMSGCTLGLVASLLVVVFLVYRIAPKKAIGLPILFGGWSLSAYMIWLAWSNFSSLIHTYQNLVIGYFVTVLLVSFAVCYRKGPPTDARSHDLAQWALQIISFVLIFATSQIPEVSFAVMALLLSHALIGGWLGAVATKVFAVPIAFYHRLFPPRVRLLTPEEYERQKEETTRRELEKLQQYCRSPEANTWKITSSIRNPSKFARFVEGREGHVSTDESMRHEMSLAFDEDEMEEDDEYWQEQNREEEEEEEEFREELTGRRNNTFAFTPRNPPKTPDRQKVNSAPRPSLQTKIPKTKTTASSSLRPASSTSGDRRKSAVKSPPTTTREDFLSSDSDNDE